jgi:hypothetical protein
MKKYKIKRGVVVYMGETKEFERIKALNFLDFLYQGLS